MNRIKQLRKKSGLTQIQLAEKTGLNVKTISYYELGKRKNNPKKWQVLADFFNVSVPYLRGNDKNVYDLKFPTKQESIDFIHKIMKAQNISLEDITKYLEEDNK